MKKLELKITGCEECPFCHYDYYYDTRHDSGWDCNHPNSEHLRIIDEGPTGGRTSKSIQNMKRVKRILKTQVPKWCPLPDIILKKK